MKIVIIGRFQPLHLGHLVLFQAAFAWQISQPKAQIFVVLGSAYQFPNIKNPFSAEQRKQLICQTFPNKEINFIYQRDYHDDQLWCESLQLLLGDEVLLIYYAKDESSYYLNLFPEWQPLKVSAVNNFAANQVRELLFSAQATNNPQIANLLPANVSEYLQQWKKTTIFNNLLNDFAYFSQFQQLKLIQPALAQIEIIILIIAENKILLQRKTNLPSQGSLCLPFQVLANNERIATCQARLIQSLCNNKSGENSSLNLLLSYLVDKKIRDHPSRIIAPRSIAHVFHYDLATSCILPVAENYFFCSIEEILQLEDQFYADHFLAIIDTLQLWPRLASSNR